MWFYGTYPQPIKEAKEWKMPPVIYQLTKEYWEQIRPWKIPFELADKYHWYVSVIGMDDYLIMPVSVNRKEVFYSARRLTNNGGLKYRTPPVGTGGKYVFFTEGIAKAKWVFIVEGIADAVWVSGIYPAIALLGTYWNDSLIPILKGKKVIATFDGDMPGIGATAGVLNACILAGIECNFLRLPNKKDPTDLSYAQIRALMKRQLK